MVALATPRVPGHPLVGLEFGLAHRPVPREPGLIGLAGGSVIFNPETAGLTPDGRGPPRRYRTHGPAPGRRPASLPAGPHSVRSLTESTAGSAPHAKALAPRSGETPPARAGARRKANTHSRSGTVPGTIVPAVGPPRPRPRPPPTQGSNYHTTIGC